MDSHTPPQIAWYKTRAGKIFLGILGLLGIGILCIGGLAGYYAWQISQGKGEELAKLFNNEELSRDPLLAVRAQTTHDANATVRPLNPTSGPDDAEVTIIAFIDFECPFCQRSYSTVKSMLTHYDPAVRVVFKHFPLTSIHPNAMIAANAAACAQEQDAFWPYYDLLFQQKQFDTNSLETYATQLGLNHTQFATCLSGEKYRAHIEQDFQDGLNLGVQGTPTYFINNTRVQGNVDRDIWDQVILDHIKQSSSY